MSHTCWNEGTKNGWACGIRCVNIVPSIQSWNCPLTNIDTNCRLLLVTAILLEFGRWLQGAFVCAGHPTQLDIDGAQAKWCRGWVAGCGYVPRVISGLRVRTKWLWYVRRVIKGRHSHRYGRPTFTSGCGGGGVSWGGVDFPLDVFCLPTMQPPQPLEAWLAWQWWCWCKVIAGVPPIDVSRMAPPAVVVAIDVHK